LFVFSSADSALLSVMAKQKPIEDALFANQPAEVKQLQKQAAAERRQKQRAEWFKQSQSEVRRK
jgi:hypothetical protein